MFLKNQICIKKEMSNYLINFESDDLYEEYGYVGNSKTIYLKLFGEPVQNIFYWSEDDYQGSIYVVYKYTSRDNKIYYIVGDDAFGSCSECDCWEGTRDLKIMELKLSNTFNNLQIYENLNDIKLGKYTHPELVTCFNKFLETY